jgi:hypothetical protein
MLILEAKFRMTKFSDDCPMRGDGISYFTRLYRANVVNWQNNEEQTDRYAKQHIIESILWSPLDNPVEYGLVAEDDSQIKDFWLNIARTARRPDLVNMVEELVNDFREDPNLPVKILADIGISLRPIDESCNLYLIVLVFKHLSSITIFRYD